MITKRSTLSFRIVATHVAVFHDFYQVAHITVLHVQTRRLSRAAREQAPLATAAIFDENITYNAAGCAM